jgi:hypothetical protein
MSKQDYKTLYFDCAKCVLHTERLFKERYIARTDTHTEFAMQTLALLPPGSVQTATFSSASFLTAQVRQLI